MNRPWAFAKPSFRWIVVVLLVGFAVPALAQNTKGERPVNNQKQVRETKSKSVKRKDKSKTRDIAGRRLRTKNKSSANSANVGIRQPDPYSKRPRIHTDRASKPRQRVYAERPSERPRAPKGDVSGHPLRTTRPRKTEAARSNVYPQSGPFMNNPEQRPRGDRPAHVSGTAASGKPIIRRVPQQKERAWKGDIKGQPVGPPRSVSSQRRNTFSQQNQYSQYVQRKAPRERAVSNQREVNRTARMTTAPRTRSGGAVYPASASKSYVKRGRKNVYWGKFSKGEKPFTRDLTGAPLRQKNYRSPAAGLVGRDTLAHFGRKPGGDATFGGKRRDSYESGRPSRRNGWRGDISGHRLRGGKPAGRQVAGQQFLPFDLSSSKTGENAGKPLRSAPISKRRKGEVAGQPLPGKTPGLGGFAVANGIARTKGKPVKGFSGQGEGFSGLIKSKKPFKGGGSVSGHLWNNGQTAIPAHGVRPGSQRVSGYPGSINGQKKTFENQGEGFSGFIKAKKPFKGGGSVSGQLWNNRQMAIPTHGVRPGSQRVSGYPGSINGQKKTFENQGEGFAGYIKARKPLKGGGSVSGQLWNNRQMAIPTHGVRSGAQRVSGYPGSLKGQTKTIENQGEGFSGYVKTKKPLKGGGSVSGQLWNNRNAPINRTVLPRGADKPGAFSGNLRDQRVRSESLGVDFSGYTKARKPLKGGGSVSGQLWNNNGEPVTNLDTSSESISASQFKGRTKYRSADPSTSGFDSDGKNKVRVTGKPSASGFDSDGKNKVRIAGKPSSSGFDSDGKSRVRVAGKPSTSGFDGDGKTRMKADFTQSPNAVDASTKKHTPSRNRFEVNGLQVRIERPNYTEREHTVSGALRGVGPSRSSVRASQHSSGARVTAERKHNPNSDDDALKGTYYGGGKMGSFHGNVKVKKFGSDRRLHPDAKFAHNADNNVKEERTILTNVKLFWTKLFHKSESQPNVVRQKERRPRYDKGEIGMWAE